MSSGRTNMAEALTDNLSGMLTQPVISENKNQLVIMHTGYDTPLDGVHTHEKFSDDNTNIRTFDRPQVHVHFAPAHTPGFRDVPQSVRDEMSYHYREYRAAVWGDYEAGRPAGSTDVRSVQAEHVQAFADMLDDYSELYDAAVRKADERMGSGNLTAGWSAVLGTPSPKAPPLFGHQGGVLGSIQFLYAERAESQTPCEFVSFPLSSNRGGGI